MSGIDVDALFDKPRQYMVLNSTDEAIRMDFDGETFVVPASYDIVVEDPGHPMAPYSGKDSNGTYIPGSLVLSDIHEQRWVTDDGKRPAVWSARDAIKHCLGIDPKTREANSEYAKKGVSVVPIGAPAEEVAKVRAQGEARYQVWLVKWARATVNGYQERAAKNRAVGFQPEPPGPEYDKAIFVLEQAKRTQVGMEMDTESALQDLLNSKVRELAASKATSEADTERLAKALAADPEFMKLLKAQLIMAKPERKKG